MAKGSAKEPLPDIPGGFTTTGKIALMMVKEKVQEYCGSHVATLIEANKRVREKLKK